MAATELESLVVKLSLDIKQLQEGSRRADDVWRRTEQRADRGRKKIEGVGTAGVSALGALGKAATRFVGIGLVALAAKKTTDFFANTINSLQEIGINSRHLNVAASNLDGFRRAADAVGSSSGSLENVLGALKEVQNYRGVHPLAGPLKSLQAQTGVMFSLNDDPLQMLAKIGEALKKLNKADQQIAASKLGIDAAMLQALLDGTLIEQGKKLEKISVVDEKKVQQAKEFNKNIAEMNARFMAAFNTIYGQLAPEINSLFKSLNKGLLDFSNWTNREGPNIRAFFNGISSAASNAAKVIIDDTVASLNVLSKWFDSTDFGNSVNKNLDSAVGKVKKWHEGFVVGLVDKIVDWQDKPASTPSIIPKASAAAPAIKSPGQRAPVNISQQYKKGQSELSPAQIKAELMKQGWSENAALGILANIKAESGFDHRAMGDWDSKTGTYLAYGYTQMHPHYTKDIEKFTGKKMGQESPEEQLRFLTHVLKTKHPQLYKQMQSASSAGQAASAMTLDYERPANKHAKARERAKIAENMAASMRGGIPPARANAAPSKSVSQTINISRAEIKTDANNVRGLSESITDFTKNHKAVQSAVRGYL